MTWTTARLATLSIALFTLPIGSTTSAEQEKMNGIERTQGWIMADDSGELGFVDCQGRHSFLNNARIEPSTQRCPTSPAPIEITTIVRSVDLVRRIVLAEDDLERPRAFHITEDVPRLQDLKPGERIQATGPIEGQVTGIARR